MKVLWVELVLLTFSISSSFILHCNTYSPVEYIVRVAEETWLDKSLISFWNETFFKSTTKRFINGSSRVRWLERNSWRSPKNVFVGGWCEEYRSYDTVMLITVSVLFILNTGICVLFSGQNNTNLGRESQTLQSLHVDYTSTRGWC